MDKRNTLISKMSIYTYKFGNKIYYGVDSKLMKPILMIIYKILDFVFVKVIAGSDIPAQARIGNGLYLTHGGRGVVIHPGAKIGDNAVINHQVTIGSDRTGNAGAPIIGDNVFIGVGAKVLGTLSIGNNVKIGANAVVITDVADNSTAVGIPAKVLQKKIE